MSTTTKSACSLASAIASGASSSAAASDHRHRVTGLAEGEGQTGGGGGAPVLGRGADEEDRPTVVESQLDLRAQRVESVALVQTEALQRWSTGAQPPPETRHAREDRQTGDARQLLGVPHPRAERLEHERQEGAEAEADDERDRQKGGAPEIRRRARRGRGLQEPQRRVDASVVRGVQPVDPPREVGPGARLVALRPSPLDGLVDRGSEQPPGALGLDRQRNARVLVRQASGGAGILSGRRDAHDVALANRLDADRRGHVRPAPAQAPGRRGGGAVRLQGARDRLAVASRVPGAHQQADVGQGFVVRRDRRGDYPRARLVFGVAEREQPGTGGQRGEGGGREQPPTRPYRGKIRTERVVYRFPATVRCAPVVVDTDKSTLNEVWPI